jgi:adenylate cyclase
VSGYPRQEVAQRAGVDPDYVDRLVELGILTPGAGDEFSPGDVLRARWMQSLERAGVPLEGLASAVRDGVLSFSFLDVGAYDRFAGLSGTTFHQLSAQTGIPLELLMVVREAFGFAEPHPEDTVHHNELSVVPLIQLQLSKGFRPVVIERWLRVYADSLRRIAEAEAAWWNSEVEMAMLASGMTEGEMLQAQADLGSQMTPLIEQVLLAVYHGQQEHAWSQVFVEHVEGALEATGLYRRLDRPPAMCFLNLTGYTRLTEERSDDAAADLAAWIAEYARPGEVLVSQEVVDAVEGGPVTFTEIGPVELKGVSGPLHPGGLAFAAVRWCRYCSLVHAPDMPQAPPLGARSRSTAGIVGCS